MTILLAFLHALLRPWLGGFFDTKSSQGGAFASGSIVARTLGRTPTALKFLVILLVSYFLVGGTIAASLISAGFVLALYRAWGHGPILSFPPTQEEGDCLSVIADDIGGSNDILHYFSYAALRYTLPIFLFSLGMSHLLLADTFWWMATGVLIPSFYYVSIRYLPKMISLPFYENYPAEFTTGLMVGISLATMY